MEKQIKKIDEGDEKMTNEEAIKELSYDDTAYGGNCTYEVRMEAIKALEKQIPKKVTNMKRILDFSGNYYTSRENCPCYKEGLNRSFIYCNKCGQKLDWGGINGQKKQKILFGEITILS